MKANIYEVPRNGANVDEDRKTINKFISVTLFQVSKQESFYIKFFFNLLFVSRHEVHSISTHTLHNADR